jgi:hypothetical protein
VPLKSGLLRGLLWEDPYKRGTIVLTFPQHLLSCSTPGTCCSTLDTLSRLLANQS